MSYDLAVWKESRPVASSHAKGTYTRLCSGDEGGLTPTSAVSALYRALVAKYPEIDVDEASSPWTTKIQLSDRAAVFTIRQSMVSEVAPIVCELALSHDLVCFDPQRIIVYYPPSVAALPHLRLELGEHRVIDDPTDEEIRAAVHALDAETWHVALEVADGFFIQAGLGKMANAPANALALEYREGSERRHFRTIVTDRDRVVTAFQYYAHGDETWKSLFRWGPAL